ncbi:hypothetical protein H4R34_002123 [Dimargaris verticillata]|uniref:PHD-type domain-containing protein n=1 Tax=Dimargaris verticillata TaxID=2761393 RepID=A0A9W8B3D1_9FUNG|nr:hypothetical protein H4R34_002123 [Dimargaris verticillata]
MMESMASPYLTNDGSTASPMTKRRRRNTVSRADAKPLRPDDPEEYDFEVDPAGETKITRLGELLGDRRFKFNVFQLPTRCPNRHYVLTMEVVKYSSAKDTYFLFHRNPDMVRLQLTEDEKARLIDQGVVPRNFRSRQIPFITARSAFIKYGHQVVIQGVPVIDDYYEAEAREQHNAHELRALETKAARRGQSQTLSDTASVGSASLRADSRRSATPNRAGVLNGGRGASIEASSLDMDSFMTPPRRRARTPARPPPPELEKSLPVRSETLSPVLAPDDFDEQLEMRYSQAPTGDRWLLDTALSILRYNHQLRRTRQQRTKYWDPHTYVHQVPRHTQPTQVDVSLDSNTLPSAADASMPEMPLSPSLHFQPCSSNPDALTPRAIDTAADEAYPLSLMPGQYQGMIPANAGRWNQPSHPHAVSKLSRGVLKAALAAELPQRPLAGANTVANARGLTGTSISGPSDNQNVAPSVSSTPGLPRKQSQGLAGPPSSAAPTNGHPPQPAFPTPSQQQSPRPTLPMGSPTGAGVRKTSGNASFTPGTSGPNGMFRPSPAPMHGPRCQTLTPGMPQPCPTLVEAPGQRCPMHRANGGMAQMPSPLTLNPASAPMGVPNGVPVGLSTLQPSFNPQQQLQMHMQLQMQMAQAQGQGMAVPNAVTGLGASPHVRPMPFGASPMGMPAGPVPVNTPGSFLMGNNLNIGLGSMASPSGGAPVNGQPNGATMPSPAATSACANCHQSVPPPQAFAELAKTDATPPQNLPAFMAKAVVQNPALVAPITCTKCHQRHHPICLNITSPRLLTAVRSYSWQCHDCKLCTVCDEAGDEASLLICDDCERGWHMGCCDPKVEEVPQGRWLCPTCADCHSCHGQRIGVARTNKAPLTSLHHHATLPAVPPPQCQFLKTAVTQRAIAARKATDRQDQFASYAAATEPPRVLNEALTTFLATYCTTCYGHFLANRFCPVCVKTYASSTTPSTLASIDTPSDPTPRKKRGRKPKKRRGRQPQQPTESAVDQANHALSANGMDADEDEDDADMNMICCDTCDRWVHIHCDPELTPDRYQYLDEHEDAKYSCPLCEARIPANVYHGPQSPKTKSPVESPWRQVRGLGFYQDQLLAVPCLPASHVTKLLGNGKVPQGH